MRATIDSIRAEYERFKSLGEDALGQLTDQELWLTPGGQGNPAAALVRHIAGNLASRFTDFLTSDGEKPWRDRESEFVPRALTDDDLGTSVTIRGQPLAVREALHRSLAHAASHVGRVVFLAKSIRGGDWRYLSIPPGQSAVYNANPVLEKAPRAVGRGAAL